MKRISIIIFLCFFLSSTAISRDYTSTRYRTRWSPYAQGLVSGYVKYSPYAVKYNGNGLVPDHVKYSPYAQGLVPEDTYYSPYAAGYNKSGLVCKDVRYSPYATGYNKTGLVVDQPRGAHCSYSKVISYSSPNTTVKVYKSISEMVDTSRQKMIEQVAEYQEKRLATLEARKAMVQERKQQNTTKEEPEPQDVIKEYLKSRNIEYKTYRTLRTQGKLLSIDLLLTETNILISYWNPVEILTVKKESEKNAVFCEKYLENWKTYCSEYLNGGMKICQIVSSGTMEVLAELENYGIN